MQFIPICLFLVICSYSLVSAAPVKQANPDPLETKQHKATIIAERLLKELANEKVAPHHESEEKVKPAVEQQVEPEEDESDSEEAVDLMPSMDDLYQIYSDRYAQVGDEEDSASSELNDDEEAFPVNKQQLMKLTSEQDDSDEHLTPVIHTPVMDDSIMTAEDHHQQ